jgi:hypothetical protein
VTVTAKCLLESKQAENSLTTQYTAGTGTRTIIDKFVAYNANAASQTLTVYITASGGTASGEEIQIVKALASGETYSFPELVGQILNAGDFISTNASAATSINIRISGREIT